MSSNKPTAVITGTTHGIGIPTAREIARAGYATILACRNLQAAEKVAADIRQVTGNSDVSVLHLDLADLDNIRRAAAELNGGCDQIKLLVNNAGMVAPKATHTAAGHEMTFATNHLGPFLFTRLLMQRLQAAPQSRIVTVASDAHRFGHLDFNDLHYRKRPYRAMQAYGTSKLANIMMNASLARRLKDTTTTANCLHPGFVGTNLTPSDNLFYRAVGALIRLLVTGVEEGAKTSIHLALSPAVAGVSGCYFDQRQNLATASAEARNEALQEQLWQLSSDLVGLPP